MSKLALRAQTVDIANLSLRQDLLAKNVLMTTQRNFCLSNILKSKSTMKFLTLTTGIRNIILLKLRSSFPSLYEIRPKNIILLAINNASVIGPLGNSNIFTINRISPRQVAENALAFAVQYPKRLERVHFFGLSSFFLDKFPLSLSSARPACFI